jgi:hypothetical protein
MGIFFSIRAPILLLVTLLFCRPLYASEKREAGSYLTGGLGVEQITYKEKVPDLDLASSGTDLLNVVLSVEAQKVLDDFFIGAKGRIPLSTGEEREYWTRGNELVQTNSLTYRWARADVHAGYFLHRLLNPYIGVQWAYAAQDRNYFEPPGTAGETAREEVYSLSALAGIQGGFQLGAGLSLAYYAEYMMPFHVSVTNSSLPGWNAEDTGGYSYAASARLNYAYSKTVAAVLQISGGRQHWDGSDWFPVQGARVRWPENDTDFLGLYISFCKYF